MAWYGNSYGHSEARKGHRTKQPMRKVYRSQDVMKRVVKGATTEQAKVGVITSQADDRYKSLFRIWKEDDKSKMQKIITDDFVYFDTDDTNYEAYLKEYIRGKVDGYAAASTRLADKKNTQETGKEILDRIDMYIRLYEDAQRNESTFGFYYNIGQERAWEQVNKFQLKQQIW